MSLAQQFLMQAMAECEMRDRAQQGADAAAPVAALTLQLPTQRSPQDQAATRELSAS